MTRRFVETYDANKVSLHVYLRHLGADPETANDVLADAMVRVWEGLGRGATPVELRAYLRRTVRNAYFDHCRASQRRREVLVSSHDATLDHASPEPQDEWLGLDRVQRALARLPRRYRRVLELSVEGRGLAWVADELGLPSANAAGIALHRARHALRNELLADDRQARTVRPVRRRGGVHGRAHGHAHGRTGAPAPPSE
ncbi:RNA polymerase sigma factor [Nocardioides stalactiti]|uniref:RNA polymerase sigma factor n=1 Tax=Nocardioides stalactiti TaxID=2755356 RepID=UPI0016010FDE|nr:RNA polymerase sigma factor [Nocardioides stalactiti]